MQGGVRSYAEKSFASGKHSGVPMPVKVDTPSGTPSVPQMVFSSLWPANKMQSLPSLDLRVKPKAELKAESKAESIAELKVKSKFPRTSCQVVELALPLAKGFG